MGIIETNEVNFLKTLKKHKYENIVIHYNCENCDDEQVTYNEEVTDDMIEQFKNCSIISPRVMIGLPCTNCGTDTVFSKINYIQGIELMF